MVSGWPSDVIPALRGKVRQLVNHVGVIEFYIGRTTNLAASKSRHGCERIIPIYKTASADNAIQVEGILIASFFNHPNCSNDAPHSGGGVADGYTNYVYVAVWYY